jgi:hypothetical protein
MSEDVGEVTTVGVETGGGEWNMAIAGEITEGMGEGERTLGAGDEKADRNKAAGDAGPSEAADMGGAGENERMWGGKPSPMPLLVLPKSSIAGLGVLS